MSYYQQNKERIKARSKKWYEENKDQAKANAKRNAPKYRKRKNALSKIRWREQRVALLKQVGKGVLECIKCSFSDIRALQVDHVNGGGMAEVRNSKFRNPERYAKHIAKNPKNYQLLCANCNWIKKYENKEHKKR